MKPGVKVTPACADPDTLCGTPGEVTLPTTSDVPIGTIPVSGLLPSVPTIGSYITPGVVGIIARPGLPGPPARLGSPTAPRGGRPPGMRPGMVPLSPPGSPAPKPSYPGLAPGEGLSPSPVVGEELGSVPATLPPAEAQLAKNLVWQTLFRIGGTVLDFVTLALYSADLGPNAQQEAALVAQTVSSAEPNPFYNPEYQPDPFAEPAPYVSPSLAPDTSGLPEPVVQPSLGTITVSGTRPSALATPFVVPGFAAAPGVFLSPGVFPASGVSPRAGTRTGLSTPSIPSTGLGFARGLAPNTLPRTAPGLLPGLRGGVQTAVLSPTLAGPTSGERGAPASASDCGAPGKSKDQKQKKKRNPRNVCYRGVYYERKNGLTKFRREQIPCR